MRLKQIREKIKTYYRNTPLSYLDLIPRHLSHELFASPMYDSWRNIKKSAEEVRYLAIGASDVTATGSWPHGYPGTIIDILKASGSKVKFKVYQNAIWGSYARQIHEKLRLNFERHQEAHFDFCTVMVGYNDGLWNIPAEQFELDLENLIKLALKRCQYVYLLNMKDLKDMPPLTGIPWFIEKFYSNAPFYRYVDNFNEIIESVVSRFDKQRVVVVPIRESWKFTGEREIIFDGLHPNIAGYNKVARIIAKTVCDNDKLLEKIGIKNLTI